MKKFLLIICTGFLGQLAFSQSFDTLHLYFYSQNPFAYTDNGSVRGIEIDILNEYAQWLRNRKKLSFTIKHISYSTFEEFYGSVKRADKNSFGLGSVTINAERAKEVDFSSAYLKDVAFCVTNGHAPDIKTKTPDEIVRALGSMSALTINNTSLNKYTLDLKRQFLKELKISYYMEENKILDEISKNVLYFGYVDAVSFWFFLKTNPGKFLKMQKILSQSSEELGFVLPKGSPHKAWFAEFFNGPNGFKNTPAYRAILEKYLGVYMTQNMAVN